ncbi:MAG: hypothetical protein IKB09_06770 [Oscillospiraceae bacterium]|nr:hypothetical protein [Oscillospiraceae bacterium]
MDLLEVLNLIMFHASFVIIGLSQSEINSRFTQLLPSILIGSVSDIQYCSLMISLPLLRVELIISLRKLPNEPLLFLFHAEIPEITIG